MGQIFVNSAGFIYFIPMQVKSDTHHALHDFKVNVGIMVEIITNGALELVCGKCKETIDTYNIKASTTEPHSLWQNQAEGKLESLKRLRGE